jgi:hypothetical protein
MTEEGKNYEVHLSDHVGITDDLSVVVNLTAEGVVTRGPADSLGLPIAHTYTITASALSEPDEYHYELRDPNGNVLVSGPGNELTDVLLGMAVGLEDKAGGDE